MQGTVDGSGLLSADQLPAASKATKVSVDSIKSGERLMDFIDIAFKEKERLEEYEDNLRAYEDTLIQSAEMIKNKNSVVNKFGLVETEKPGLNFYFYKFYFKDIAQKPPSAPLPNPLLMGKTWDKFMLQMFRTIKSSELEEVFKKFILTC